MKVHADVLRRAKSREERARIKWFAARDVFFVKARFPEALALMISATTQMHASFCRVSPWPRRRVRAKRALRFFSTATKLVVCALRPVAVHRMRSS